MIDYTKIKVKAGSGGAGAVSFQRLRGQPYGPTNGGDGGDGGDVYLVVNKDLNTLRPYRFKKDFKASDGAGGGKNRKRGANGEDLFLELPTGTKITDERGQLIADLTGVGEKVMVVKGGRGGRGNAHIKKSDLSKSRVADRGSISDKRQATSYWHWHEEGEEGKEISVTLELKLLADVGLIGLPNAGKSTLLSRLTAATPKIAPYPFTTLEPNLGVMNHKGKELVLADIPGLIEGASSGKGLGDLFLRHVERTKILVHLVSVEAADSLEAIAAINKELKSYSKDLADKPQVILLTKIDTVGDEELKNKIDQFKKRRRKILPISAMSGEGLDQLRDEIIKRV